MTYNPDSWRDDFEPNVHPTIAQALHHLRTGHAAQLANEKATGSRWPFPLAPIPLDRKPPPRQPDAEGAPW